MTAVRVLVTGAYGLIGTACLVHLHQEGHSVVGAGRSIGDAQRQLPFAPWRQADFNHLTTAESWAPVLADIDAVVNCVGVLQDGARDDVRTVQLSATVALFAACERAQIRRFIHISALGAARDAPTAFARTKAQAEEDLAGRDLDWVILRPGLVLAAAVYGGSAMLRAVAAMPWALPVILPEARVQVIGIDDLARTVARCLEGGAPARVRWDVAHPHVHTLAEIALALRRWLGLAPARVIRVPGAVGRLVAAVADGLAYLGWRSPARSTATAQLAAGVVGNPAAWIAATGFKPRNLDEVLAATPSTVQDRWHARLYLVKPLAIGVLALFWLISGIVTLGPGRVAAEAQLAATAFPSAAVRMTVLLGGLLDIGLGLLLLVRAFTRAVLMIMLATTLAYLALGTALAPGLWLDPLGALLKAVPVMLAMLLTAAIMDER